GLDDRATHKLTYRPGSGAALLTRLQSGEGDVGAALAEGPLVALVGRTGYGEDGRLAEAVAAHVRTLGGKILPLARRSNVYGALDMGLAPGLAPGRAQAERVGKGTVQILEALTDGSLIGLLLVGADPVRDVPNGELARQALEKARFVVALDQFLTDSSRLADVVLPVEGFAEKEGTVTNVEGRVQKVNRVVPGPGQSRADWSILDDLSERMGRSINLASAEAIAKEIATEAPAYLGITWDVLESQNDGVVVPLPEATQPLVYLPADAPGKSPSAELVLHYARTMFDDGVLLRHGPSIEHLAPGASVYLNFDDARRLGLAEGDQADVKTTQGSARLSVRIDPNLTHGVVYVPFNQPGTPSLGSDPVVTISKP
ncbi:MAG TPA: molybdopterin-dependent oxidoreductase, partial [Acidimicrobiia bacterium]|nr:molybdopterin-dependent oxidoreductase [Acidimicrobiia bacterium]